MSNPAQPSLSPAQSDADHAATTFHVEVASGHIGVQVEGDGPLLLCVPGMGESAASFRHLTPLLVDAGYRVAAMDLRGHGESSTAFQRFDDEAAASDIHSVLEHLGVSAAAVIGNSMGAAAGVIAAQERPDLVQKLVLIGPFVRDHGSRASRILLALMLARPWGPAGWASHYRCLFGDVRPADHDEHVGRALAQLRRPGRWRAFQRTARTSHAGAEAALQRLSTPLLVIMGDQDRDFDDAEVEAAWAAEAGHGDYRMIAGAGHYPQGEQPEVVAEHVLAFLGEASRG